MIPLISGGPGTGTPPGDKKSQPYDFLAPAQGPEELGRLGSYRILSVLGAGGMGVVFRAEDLLLQRQVALKVMLPALAAQPVNHQRFLREARAAAALDHDHIVHIYHVGEDRGVPYLAMQFLRGESLEDRLKREGKLPVADVLRIGRETAEGLAAAHDLGLIHRDIKPANIWLESGRGRVKILDFGLVREAAGKGKISQSGMILGTPGFMAPEQARGKVVDHRCDLFSLGCLLYRMCTGQLPFQGKDRLTTLLALVSSDPKPVREANPEVPAELAALIQKLMAKDPTQRPASAYQVVQALEAIEKRSLPTPGPIAEEARPAPEGILGLSEDWEPSLEGEPEEPGVTQLPPAPPEEQAAVVTPVAHLTSDSLEMLAGQTLGSYELGSVLGTGFYGAVFRTQDLKKGRIIALKVFSPEFPQNDTETQRFIAALKPVLPLRHPNLVRVFGAGKTRCYCWIAREFVEGESLASVIQNLAGSGKKIDWRQAFRVALHMSRALEFLSQNHLVHGNLTPANVLWQRSDQVAKLANLGVSQALEGSLLQKTKQAKKRRAELPFLAPERIEGAGPNEVSDLYSLGVLIYALLTGRLPFEGTSPLEILRQIRTGRPAKPTRLQRSIPQEMEWVTLTLLAWEKKYRFQNSAEVLAHLDHIGLEQSVPV
ncbi:MAG: protein kinase [Planctomycetes bacterium]|nr:protein kinase [Planctomycetota bacterium]